MVIPEITCGEQGNGDEWSEFSRHERVGSPWRSGDQCGWRWLEGHLHDVSELLQLRGEEAGVFITVLEPLFEVYSKGY